MTDNDLLYSARDVEMLVDERTGDLRAEVERLQAIVAALVGAIDAGEAQEVARQSARAVSPTPTAHGDPGPPPVEPRIDR